MEQGHVTVTFQWIVRQVSVEKDNEKRKSQEEFEDTKGVIRIRKSKKNRQHNGQKEKNKKTRYDLQNPRAARTPLKSGGELSTNIHLFML